MKRSTEIKLLPLDKLEVGHMIYVHVNATYITSYLSTVKYTYNEKLAVVTKVGPRASQFSATTMEGKFGDWAGGINDIYILRESSKTLRQRRKLLKLYMLLKNYNVKESIHKLIWQQEGLTANQMKDCNALWKIVQ